MRSFLSVPLAAFLGLGLSLPVFLPTAQADGRSTRPDTLPVSAIKKGMKGYGLTVFEGTKPEKFGVEVIDILHNFKPRQELILVKTDHPRLDVAKIVGGMSGSPIYLQGKMVGAYAYGWTFGVEPVAGVTPIASMIDDMERPLPAMLHGYPLRALPKSKSTARSSRDEPGRYQGELGSYTLAAHRDQLRAEVDSSHASSPSLTRVSTPLLMGGMTQDAVQLAQSFLSPLGLMPLQAGGSAGSVKREDLADADGYLDGGALGVDLVSGDLSAMGLGTVTRVEKNRLVAFGHPMMGVGITSLPTTRARVLWFMASQMRSFKMGEGTLPLGALVNDRQSSIVVHQDIEAPTVDVSLKIEGEPGAPYQDWNFRVASDRFLTPSLIGVALGSGLSSTAAERREVTWAMISTIEFDGYDPIVVEDFGSTFAGTPEASQVMQSRALESIGQVLNNPWGPARVKSVKVKVSLKFAREVAELRGVDLLTPEVRPGGEARLRLRLEPYDGKQETRVVRVAIPHRFAGQTVSLTVRPGYAVEPHRAAPESLAELVSNLAVGTLKPRSMVVSYDTGEGGAALEGVVAENLPPFALDTLTSTHSSQSPAQFRSEQHQVVSTPYFVIGTDSVRVRVRDK